MNAALSVDWSAIDTVLLDMDGTLLDLRFDNWFWQELIPSLYAAANGLALADTHALLTPKFIEVKGTLQWYCIDYWTRELKLDIGSIKREAQRHVSFLPGAEQFLSKLRVSGNSRTSCNARSWRWCSLPDLSSNSTSENSSRNSPARTSPTSKTISMSEVKCFNESV